MLTFRSMGVWEQGYVYPHSIFIEAAHAQIWSGKETAYTVVSTHSLGGSQWLLVAAGLPS